METVLSDCVFGTKNGQFFNFLSVSVLLLLVCFSELYTRTVRVCFDQCVCTPFNL